MSEQAPIRKTVMLPTTYLQGSIVRQECWGAETTDGVWSFERIEESGTPWVVWHKPSLADQSCRWPVMRCGSLEACQQAVAMGWADAELANLKAEEVV